MKKYLPTEKYCKGTPYPRHIKQLIKYVADKEAEMMIKDRIVEIPTNMVRHTPTKNFTGIFSFVNYQIGRILP